MFDVSPLTHIWTYLKTFRWQDWLTLVGGVIGISSIVAGFCLVFYTSARAGEVQLVSQVEQLPPSSDTSQIQVFVSGAVKQPGLYSLQANDRVMQAVTAAGGLTLEADQAFIHKNINLAQHLEDGQLIYIPFQEEEVTAGTLMPPLETAPNSELTSLNQASQAELEALPSIGAKKAAQIIENRPFGSLDELVVKKILSQKSYDELKHLISL